MDFITRQIPRRKRLEVIPLAFLADPAPQPVATDDQVVGAITLKANKFAKSERWLLDTVPLDFLADPVPNPDDQFAGAITLKANRVSRKVKRLDVQPYDAWLGFGIAQLTMPVVGDFDTNAILHPGWRIYVTDNSTGSDVDVYADNVANQTHAKPVKIDRYGNTPIMWVDASVTYDIDIKNEFGVLRYSATGITV